MARPKLSVTMCNYNHAAYVGQALKAVLEQTRPPDEIVVVDDGSTDDSLAVLKPLAQKHPQIHLIVNPQNMGVCNSAAIAASQVSGEYLAAPTADDVLEPTFFERALDLLEKNPQAGLAVGCVEDVYPDGRREFPAFQLPTVAALPEACYVSPQKAFELERACVPLGLLGYASVFRSDLYFPTMPHSQKTGYLSDWLYLRVVAFRHGYCFIPHSCGLRRMLPGSMSSNAQRHWKVRRDGLVGVLEELRSPRFADVRGPFRDSGALAAAGYQLVAWLLTQPRYWSLLTPHLFWRGWLNFQGSLLPEAVKTLMRRAQARLQGKHRPDPKGPLA